MKKHYTTDELSKIFGVSSRTIQRHISKIVDELSANSKGYKIPKNIALKIANKCNYEFQNEIDGHVVRTEYFTENEYAEFHKRLSEYPILKNLLKVISDKWK